MSLIILDDQPGCFEQQAALSSWGMPVLTDSEQSCVWWVSAPSLVLTSRLTKKVAGLLMLDLCCPIGEMGRRGDVTFWSGGNRRSCHPVFIPSPHSFFRCSVVEKELTLFHSIFHLAFTKSSQNIPDCLPIKYRLMDTYWHEFQIQSCKCYNGYAWQEEWMIPGDMGFRY